MSVTELLLQNTGDLTAVKVSDTNPLPFKRVPTNGRYPFPFTFPLAGSVQVLVKNATGYLNSVAVSNINASVRYLQIFNQSTAPASTQVPILSFPIPAGTATVPGSFVLGTDFLGDDGLYLTNGIAIGISTAAASFTAATTTDHTLNGTFS